MNTFIASWLQDQIHECPEAWDFPDDFDADKAHRFIFNNFNNQIITDHLDQLLIDYLH
tara:strand:+ start:178 stop:351 length:174 start_codon:yes stop_codon:yes gene_type:complete